MMSRKITTILSVLLIWSLTSCVKTDLLPSDSSEIGEVGKPVQVDLCFKIPPVLQPEDQAMQRVFNYTSFSVALFKDASFQTRSSGITELYNLWLFQFNNTGAIQGKPQMISNQVEMVNDMALLGATLTVGADQTLYLVALGKKVTPLTDLNNVHTLSELENISLRYLDNEGGLYYSRITNDSEVPYGGKVSGVSVREIGATGKGEIVYGTPDGFFGGIEIKRLVSQVVLKHKFDLPQNKLKGLRILKVPTTLFVNPASVASDVIESVRMVDLEGANAFKESDKDPDGFFTSQWYIAQNRQGDVPGITIEQDRYRKLNDKDVVLGTAPELGTNIEMWSYDKADTANYAIHQIYIGNNNTSNFDVDINTRYNLRTIVNSLDMGDGRIRTQKAAQKIYFTSTARSSNSTTNSGTLLGQTNVPFDSHYGWRPITIDAQGRKVSVGLYTDKECTKLVDMNDPTQNWLQLSAYPNYTEVMRNGGKAVLSNLIETEIFLPTRFKLYLYADEYLTNDDGSIQEYTFDKNKRIQLATAGNPTTFLNRRTLYIRITTSSADQKQRLEAKCTLDQQQGYYVGLLGGDLVDGQYTKGLITDSFNEYKVKFEENYPVSLTYAEFCFGYYGVFTNYSWSASNTPEQNYRSFTNGKQATYKLATNPDNYVVNTNAESKFPNVKKINGVVDLYQYDYHRSFIARYCYDLNRDRNGNGQIDFLPNDPINNEYEWYLPSTNQVLGLLAASGTHYHDYTLGTTAESSANYAYGVDEMNGGWTSSNGTKTYSKKMRCVRDIPVPDQLKQGNKATTYTEPDGTTYVMIDLSTLPSGITDRTTSEGRAALYEELDLYSYSSKGVEFNPDAPVPDSSKPLGKKVYRAIRNAIDIGGSTVVSNRLWAYVFCSRKFVVSPTDVYNDGDIKSNPASDLLKDANDNPKANSLYPTWAAANGRLNTADTQTAEIASQATMTGCSAYRGKNGTDAQGTWRVPSHRELSVILIYAHDLPHINAAASFQPLSMTNSATSYTYGYWTSSTQFNYNGDSALSGAIDVNYGLAMTSGTTKTNNYGRTRLRCIKDIP